ncbi:MAG: hypothetical protein M3081_16300 [Gemmatimonadota bacterium]|nr:hypothetical protein [Gemmatimonadota bacterium]
MVSLAGALRRIFWRDAHVLPELAWLGLVASLTCIVFWALSLRRSTARMRQSEALFRAAIDGSLDAFVVYRSIRDVGGAIIDFEIVDANRRAETLCTQSRDTLVGR